MFKYLCIYRRRGLIIYIGPFIILIEIAFIVWGLVEIFYRARNCEGLMYSDLWIYAIVCNVLQMIYLIIITIATLLS